MAQFSRLCRDAKKESFTAFYASLGFYIEDFALFELQIPTCLATCYLGVRSQSDVKLSHNLFKLITFCG